MTIRRISPKQRRVLTWWCPGSADCGCDAIICDGAVRSGKTLFMTISFVMWAMCSFSGQQFGLCGKTIASLRRNLIHPVLPVLRELGFDCREKISANTVTVQWCGRENTFHLFGGRDEGSAALIQGVTFAGVLFDEVALQVRSFVQQACARCSVTGSRFWFNCNPEGPEHWFYREWICRAQARSALYLHFTMADNPSLSPQVRRRYESMFTGVFYQRFIQGKWVAAEGRVYDFFNARMIREAPQTDFEEFRISCDYGTANPASFGLWGRSGAVWYRLREFYFSSREAGFQKTDADYVRDLTALAGGRTITRVVVDPSAASFIEALRRAGYRVQKADNDVLTGIRTTADLLKSGRLVICSACADAIREFSLYVWDTGDKPRKEHDHAMDEIRYFAMSVAEDTGGFAATFAER